MCSSIWVMIHAASMNVSSYECWLWSTVYLGRQERSEFESWEISGHCDRVSQISCGGCLLSRCQWGVQRYLSVREWRAWDWPLTADLLGMTRLISSTAGLISCWNVYGLLLTWLRLVRGCNWLGHLLCHCFSTVMWFFPRWVWGCVTGCDRLRLAYCSCARYVFGIRRSEHISGYSARILDLLLGRYYSFRIWCQMYRIVFTRKPDYLYRDLQFGRSAKLSNLIVRRSLFGVRGENSLQGKCMDFGAHGLVIYPWSGILYTVKIISFNLKLN
jgi:hypothetical protein